MSEHPALINGRTVTNLLISIVGAMTGYFAIDYMSYKETRHEQDLKITAALTEIVGELKLLQQSSARLDRDLSSTNQRITTFSDGVNKKYDSVRKDLHELQMRVEK